MSVKRRPRGTRKEPVRAAWTIEKDSKARFDKIAAASGVTASVFLEMVIDHLGTELSDRGVPTWMPQPEPKDGELPIDSA